MTLFNPHTLVFERICVSVCVCVCVCLRLCAHCQTFITRTRATVCYVRSTYMHKCIFICSDILAYINMYA